MFDTKNRIRIILTIFILLLVSSFPSSTFAQKLDLANEFQASDTIPKLKEMPINKVKSLKKNDNTILENQNYVENKINQLHSNNKLTLSQPMQTLNSNNGFYGYVTDYLTEEGQQKICLFNSCRTR